MTALKRILVMIVVGILIAAGIIGGVTVIGKYLPNGSQTIISNTTLISTSVSTTTETSNSSAQTGTMATLLTDPSVLPPGVSALWASYSDIEAHTLVGNASVWVTIAGAGSVNLLALQTQSVTLGSAKVSSGSFDRIRFDLTSVTLNFYGTNSSVYIQNPQLVSPLPQSGLQVNANSSVGVLIELATTVLPYQDGSKISFILTPSASSTVIPSSHWNESLAKIGATLNLSTQTWFKPTQGSLGSNLTRLIAEISPTTLLVALQNVGNTSITLSSLMVLGSSTQNQSISTSTYLSTVTSVVTITEVTTVTRNATSSTAQTPAAEQRNEVQTSMSSSTAVATFNSNVSQYIPIASFQILNDSVLSQPGQAINPDTVGVTIAPGKQVVLLFVGQISTINSPTLPNLPTSIIGGQQYLIRVSSPSGAVFDMNVTASYQS